MRWYLLAALLSAGCAADNDPGNPAPVDGGVAVDASFHDVAPERLAADGFIDLFDAFPIPDGPVGTCIECVRDRCGADVNGCANDAMCRQGLACALATCLATPADAGGPDTVCLLGCFMGNVGALLTATGALGC